MLSNLKSQISDALGDVVRNHRWVFWTVLIVMGLLTCRVLGQVGSSPDQERYACNGTTKAFVFHFGVFDTDELRVVLYNDTTGVALPLVENSTYTVSLPNDDGWLTPGGTVTTTGATAYASGYHLVISRVPSMTQESHFDTLSAIDPGWIQDDFDRSVVRDQYLQRQINHALRFPVDANVTDANLPAGSETVAGYLYLTEGVPSLKTLTNFTAVVAEVNDVNAVGDSVPYYNGSAAAWSSLQPAGLREKFDLERKRVFDVREHGAVSGDGLDDAAAAMLAVADINDAGGGILYFPAGDWELGSRIVIDSNTIVMGAGKEVTRLWIMAASTEGGLETDLNMAHYSVGVIGLTINGRRTSRSPLAGSEGDEARGSNILISYVDGFVIRDVNSCEALMCGIYVHNGSSDGLIDNCNFDKNGKTTVVTSGRAGINLGVSPSNIKIVNTTMRGNAQQGARIQNEGGTYCEHISVDHCLIADNVTDGVHNLDTGSLGTAPKRYIDMNDFSLTNCTIQGNGSRGLFISRTGIDDANAWEYRLNDAVIQNCRFIKNTSYACLIQTGPYSCGVNRSRILGNLFLQNGAGIYLSGAKVVGTKIEGNDFKDTVSIVDNSATDTWIGINDGAAKPPESDPNTGSLNLVSGAAYQINDSNLASAVYNFTATCDPNALDPNEVDSLTVAATGAALGDYVSVAAPYNLQSVQAWAYVESANVIRLKLKGSVGTVDLGSGSWKFKVIR